MNNIENRLLRSKQKVLMAKRTNRHIYMVKQNADLVVRFYPNLCELIEQVSTHDASKFEEPEKTPYEYIVWRYKCKHEGLQYNIPNEIDDIKATLHHVKNNKHHPEYWTLESDVINEDDRDEKPEDLVDATKMDIVSVAEMVCDWAAVSREHSTSLLEWANSNVGVRWNFSNTQEDFIYDLIELLINEYPYIN